METWIRKTLNGYEVKFKIDNQTFALSECNGEDTDEDNYKNAILYEKQFLIAMDELELILFLKNNSR